MKSISYSSFLPSSIYGHCALPLAIYLVLFTHPISRPQLSTASSLGDDDAWDASQATCCCGLCASCQVGTSRFSARIENIMEFRCIFIISLDLDIIDRAFAFVSLNHCFLHAFFDSPFHPPLRQTPGALCDTPFFAPSSRCSSFCTFGVRRARELCSLSRARWAAFLQSPPIVLLMATCTLLALYLDDIRSLAAVEPVSADAGFQAVIFACFIIFVAEFLLQTWAIKEYRLSLFQLLDFISCLSLLPEIPWLWYVYCFHRVLLYLFILHSLYHVVFMFCRLAFLSVCELAVPSIALFVDVFRCARRSGIVLAIPDISSGGSSGHLTVARAARISRVGSRAGRILRLVRFIRLGAYSLSTCCPPVHAHMSALSRLRPARIFGCLFLSCTNHAVYPNLLSSNACSVCLCSRAWYLSSSNRQTL